MEDSFQDTINAHTIPVEKQLGKRTRWILTSPERIDSYLVKATKRKKPLTKFDDYTILAQGPQLSNEQIDFIQELVFNPESYYNGVPMYHRFPHVPRFALRCQRENETLDIMIDLHNPGWDFYCGIGLVVN